MSDAQDVTLSGELQVAKADEDARLVFGWATVSEKADGTEVWDTDHEHVPAEDLEAAAYGFVLESRESGTDHDGGPVHGQLVESLVTTVAKQQALGLTGDELPVGWWVGFHIATDDVWKSVKAGERLMFSIDGTAIAEDVELAELPAVEQVGKALAGSAEDRQDRLRHAVREAEPGAEYVWLRGTFDDRVVYEVTYDGGACRLYERPYAESDGAFTFGDSTEVEVTESVQPVTAAA